MGTVELNGNGNGTHIEAIGGNIVTATTAMNNIGKYWDGRKLKIWHAYVDKMPASFHCHTFFMHMNYHLFTVYRISPVYPIRLSIYSPLVREQQNNNNLSIKNADEIENT